MALITERVMALDNITPNDELFERILHNGMPDNTIHDVVLVEKKSATKKGENYLSYLTRFTLHYVCDVPTENGYEKQDRVAHLILKEEPLVNEETLKNIREMNVFNTESAILENVVPKIEAAVGKRLAPKVYYSSVTPQTIVMEDLAVLGFKNRSRKVGLSEDDVKLVIDSIADYHAGTVLLNEQEPGSTSQYKNGLLSDCMPEMINKAISSGMTAVFEVASTWPEDKYKIIAEKCGRIANDIADKCRQCCKVEEDEFCVLNHGDLWINNIMFRDDDNGKVQEVRFVDFQIGIWTSPAIDLLYFLSIAPEYEIKATHDDMFIERYWNRLVLTMKKIGCSTKPPTLEQLKKSIFKRRAYFLMAGLCFYPKMTLEEEDVRSLDDMLEHDQTADNNAVKNPRAARTLQKILPIINQRGYLDLD